MYYSKTYQKRNWNNIRFSLDGTEKKTTSQAPGPTLHLEWVGQAFFDTYIELNSLKIKWSQSLLNPTNALWKDLILYRLNSVLNSNQGLPLFKQKQIVRSNRLQNFRKQNNEDFFIQLLIAWVHFINSTTSLPPNL